LLPISFHTPKEHGKCFHVIWANHITPLPDRWFVIVAISDVQGAFVSAWWPTLRKGTRAAKFTRNLYYLTQDYLKEKKAFLTIHNISLEKKITKECQQ